jgi:predicted phosphodiesterase
LWKSTNAELRVRKRAWDWQEQGVRNTHSQPEKKQMTALDLGTFDAPVLICGGAYGNLQALEALAAFQAGEGVADGNVIHTGDAVAYCADTEAATQFIAQRGWHAIKGNVEEQIASGAQDCGCGFEEGSACDVASARWYAHAVATLSDASKAWMAGLPSRLTFEMSGVRAAVVHGSVTQTNRFMWASLPETDFNGELDATGAELVIAGHTGIPFTRFIGSRCWHNSGALGMPANDGTQRVWVSVLAPLDGSISITHHALQVQGTEAAAAIRRDGLPEGYADGLETGLWPSLDILPDAERAATGEALDLNGKAFAFRTDKMAAE